jgi:hypothetical protein
MKIKDGLRMMFFLFCALTTAILLFVALQAVFIFCEVMYSGIDLLKIISISFVSVLPTFVFFGKETVSRIKSIILRFLHFILTAGAVFGCLVLFEWIEPANAIWTVLFFLLTYISASIALEIRDKRLADKLTEKINAFQNTENETHNDQS